MDVLVVVGTEPAPTRLEDRAMHVHRLGPDETLPTLIGALRARIPRRVGVFGPVAQAVEVAAGLRRAGLPTELFTDEPVPPRARRASPASRCGGSPTTPSPWTSPTPWST